MIKKVIEGYIARDGDDLIFSDQSMKQSGFFGDGGVWYPTIECEEHSPMDFRADMHEYMDIPELTEKDSPRHCTITIEVGEFVGEKTDLNFMQKCSDVRKSVESLAKSIGKTFEVTKAMLEGLMPEIKKYLED